MQKHEVKDHAHSLLPEGEWTLLMLDETHDLTPVGTVHGGESFALPAEGGAMLLCQA